jgi:hypothetical protein
MGEPTYLLPRLPAREERRARADQGTGCGWPGTL